MERNLNVIKSASVTCLALLLVVCSILFYLQTSFLYFSGLPGKKKHDCWQLLRPYGIDPDTPKTDSLFSHWEDSLGEGNLEGNLIGFPLVRYSPLDLWTVVRWVGWLFVGVGGWWGITCHARAALLSACGGRVGGVRRRGKRAVPSPNSRDGEGLARHIPHQGIWVL